MGADYLVIFVSCPDEEMAGDMADKLVRGGLAACVNIVPGVCSVYQWQGRLEKEQEWLLQIKTRTALYEDIERLIRAEHPYELPEVIAVPIVRGSSDYLEWIDQMTREN